MNPVRFLRPFAVLLALAVGVGSARAALIHRYSFTATTKDSVGHVDGRLKGAGASLAGGRLVLVNDPAAAVEKISCLEFAGPILPATGSTVSLAVWFAAKDAGEFARVLNFGASEGTEGVQFIYFSPHTGDGTSRVAITGSEVSAKTFLDFAALADGQPHCVILVVDGAAKKLHVFADGQEVAPPEDLGANTLDRVKPVENWLGKSSFAADPGLTGSIDELRVYDHALTAGEVAAIFRAGPDQLPAAPVPAK